MVFCWALLLVPRMLLLSRTAVTIGFCAMIVDGIGILQLRSTHDTDGDGQLTRKEVRPAALERTAVACLALKRPLP